ncbi:MAG: molecular chaperone TorD family protein, partial [Eggerthellaceae bacterium]|nr:molecular chaperone TorD family protein [Eggerthellaceae bacterium]
STLRLRSWMREKGIAMHGPENEPEDHIGRMLLLMSWIAANRPDLLVEFLQGHLLIWSSHYLDELAEAAGCDFYHGLAMITKDSLEGIQKELGIQVEYPQYYR